LSLQLKKQVRNFFPDLKSRELMQLEEEAEKMREAEVRERRKKRAEEMIAMKGFKERLAKISKEKASFSVPEVKIEPED
jgi:hypothetical protein